LVKIKSHQTIMKATSKSQYSKSQAIPQIPAPAVPATQSASPKPVSATLRQNGHKAVTIEVNIDVGFGNTLYLRGEGHGLSWSHGVPLTCVNRSMWKWSGEASDAVQFKLLLNDAVWSKGENLVVSPGQKLQVSPAF
jgi:hypothetical protein